MKQLIAGGLFSICVSILPGVAMAQGGACPDGRTASGRCINPMFADAMRQTAIIFSQPKISYTHYPVLPSLDWNYRYPNQLNPDPTGLSPTAPRAPGGGRFVVIF